VGDRDRIEKAQLLCRRRRGSEAERRGAPRVVEDPRARAIGARAIKPVRGAAVVECRAGSWARGRLARGEDQAGGDDAVDGAASANDADPRMSQ